MDQIGRGREGGRGGGIVREQVRDGWMDGWMGRDSRERGEVPLSVV